MGASPDAFKIVGDPLGREEFGFIFTPHSDLVAPVNAALQSMKNDGTIDRLNKKWLFDYQAGQ
jgi:polar amino acid transport system substrate-binding protein